MASRFNNLKRAFIQLDKRKLILKTYGGVGVLLTGSIIGSAVTSSIEEKIKFDRMLNVVYAGYPEKQSTLLKIGLNTVLEIMPLAVVAGVMWPVILIRAVLLDY